jgi:hypothetical protein
MLALPFNHPTFEEGWRPALRQICEVVKAPDWSISTKGRPRALGGATAPSRQAPVRYL